MARRNVVLGAVLGAGLALLVAVGLISWAAGHYTTRTTTVTVAGAAQAQPGGVVSPQVAAGAHDFVQFACAQCHGENGRGGVSPFVPSLTRVGKVLTPAQLRTIINHGLGESANPTRPYMPVWGEVISSRQVTE